MIKRAFRRLIRPYLAVVKHDNSPVYNVYTCDMDNDAVRVWANNPSERTFCEMQNGTGRVHLDIAPKRPSGYLGKIPDDCPTPRKNIEYQHPKGGELWITRGERGIYCSGLTVGQRYIFTLPGVFNI